MYYELAVQCSGLKAWVTSQNSLQNVEYSSIGWVWASGLLATFFNQTACPIT